MKNIGTVEFISYTGEYPNLCRGVLTVKINGKEFKFGHNSEQYDYKSNSYLDEDKNHPNYDEFWRSGGHIKTKKYNMIAVEAPWYFDEDDKEKYPKEIQNVMNELIYLFNQNVPHGCCGGCI